MEVSFQIILLLFCVAIVAGFIDTLAGGGGLLTLPSLLLCGLPPIAALATNKLQGAAGTATASYVLYRNHVFIWSSLKIPVTTAFVGALFGSLLVQWLDTQALSILVPIVLSIIAIYFWVMPVDRLKPTTPLLSEKKFNMSVVPMIGFYDGLFGPGTGSFFSLANVALRAQDLIQATVRAKAFNFATNLASLCVFIFSGHIVWMLGLTMVFGQFIGARLATHLLFKINKTLLRYMVVIMCVAMLVKYLASHVFN